MKKCFKIIYKGIGVIDCASGFNLLNTVRNTYVRYKGNTYWSLHSYNNPINIPINNFLLFIANRCLINVFDWYYLSLAYPRARMSWRSSPSKMPSFSSQRRNWRSCRDHELQLSSLFLSFARFAFLNISIRNTFLKTIGSESTVILFIWFFGGYFCPLKKPTTPHLKC